MPGRASRAVEDIFRSLSSHCGGATPWNDRPGHPIETFGSCGTHPKASIAAKTEACMCPLMGSKGSDNAKKAAVATTAERTSTIRLFDLSLRAGWDDKCNPL